ncbi:GATA transcription factor 1 [Lotus japonicus]|uniref:GATA transcription factor 1 n=1 Tax=Lotus japonicus TaxID=34305 RepID=UPI002590E7F7|nr:GATA transcription factor 1 [Lotus japonicus]
MVMGALGSVDDLLNFSSDIGEEDDDDEKPNKAFPSLNPICSDPPSFNPSDLNGRSHSVPAYAEEELEWLSNKDAFPAIETFVELSSIHPDLAKHQKAAPKIDYSTSSSNSNNSSNSITLLSGYDHLKVPVRARSRRRSRRRPIIADNSGQQFWWQQLSNEICKEEAIKISTIGRKCLHCGAEKTPQWRAGPHGPKTLCNACGVRFKSGRLVPEYRPASSPTFRTELHSNSHRKVMEMRKQKHMGMG